MNTRPEESALHERAPAKVNLFLHVAGRRDDGFHDLESLVVFTAFGDEVSISPSSALTLERSGPFAGDLPDNPEDDLCLRAATKLAKAFGRAPTAHIVLVKNIPVASGVGGGSSDAAAVLRGLCRLWGLDVRDPRVIGIAEDLGADVPVCLNGAAACISGIGDVVDPLVQDPAFHMLLVNPNEALATAEVFGAFAGGTGVTDGLVDSVCAQDSGTLLETISASRNDLAVAARELCPVVESVLRALEQSPGCTLARMSGSGATCFGIFPDAKSCQRAGAVISKAHQAWWVCPTRTARLSE